VFLQGCIVYNIYIPQNFYTISQVSILQLNIYSKYETTFLLDDTFDISFII